MNAADNRVVVEEGKHSALGASSSNIWLNCNGSRNLIKKLLSSASIHNRTSRPAAEGTAAHLVVSTCLEDGSDAHEMKDMEIEVADWTFIVDDEMIAGAQECIDWVRARVARAKADGFEVKLYIEKGLTSFFDDEIYGTADIIIHIIDDRMIVVDFKYGQGVSVEPTSDQNAYYLYLAIENYLLDPDSISVVESWIAQPRIPHHEGTIRRHITNVAELTDWWMNTVLPGVEATRDPNALLTIGEHCRFCPAKGHCPALKTEVFEFSTSIEVSHLTDAELGAALIKLKALSTVETTFQAEALRRVRTGDKVPGYKLVRKKSNRVMKESMALPSPENADEMVEVKLADAALDTFGVEAYTDVAIKSPAQLEKLEGGDTFVATWSYSPDNGTTLAPMSDKRREVKSNVELMRGRVQH